MADPERPRVAIAVPTFRRAATLRRLLPLLSEEIAATTEVSASVIVVDNDPERSAEAIAREAACDYVAEPRRGLSAVRNTALTAARDRGAVAVAFIDDDETPEPGWLAALVEPWLAGRADLVSGEVMSVFDGPVDPWLSAGGFFRRVRFPAGARMQAAPSNNLLIDLRTATRLALAFDERFGATGGEDIYFTRQAALRGARIVSAPDARVLDPVAPERTRRGWVLRRAYRVGTTTAACDVLLEDSVRGRALRRLGWAGRGAARSAAGALRWAWGRLSRSVVHDARGARLAARGAGMVSGALGLRYREYSRREV
ncbi:glycosyltransferase family 2 protein [Microbacterium sp. NPDC078428]|uniref:glycosyltransferase family 2 protein n=1 Tax=Microbacterium sp. NPDC078428 TaxID=3364190 RepID=UPI0037C64764